MGAPGDFADKPFQPPRYSPTMQAALSRLDNLVNWERRRRATGDSSHMRVSTLPARELLARLHNPHHHFRSVHVTGSKGKGTVAAFITAGLRLVPFVHPTAPVATLASPHVECITERLRLDGLPIHESTLASSLHATLKARDIHPSLSAATWFDVVSVAGLHAAHAAHAARAVVEVGMGGRLDSTNVLQAPVSVITNIHLEHADVIGPTLRDIAYEKAGIIAPAARVIVGLSSDHHLAAIFRAEVDSLKPKPLLRFEPPVNGESLFATNLRLARAALRAVAETESLPIPDNPLPENIARAALATLPARQEEFLIPASNGRTVLVLLDGAHVPDSIVSVFEEAQLPNPVVVLALAAEKDVPTICREVISRSPCVYATSAGSGEAYLPTDDLQRELREAGGRDVRGVTDPEKALLAALHEADERNASVIVVGSFHLAGRLRARLRDMNSPSSLSL